MSSDQIKNNITPIAKILYFLNKRRMKSEKLTKITKKIPEKPELGIDECVLGCFSS